MIILRTKTFVTALILHLAVSASGAFAYEGLRLDVTTKSSGHSSKSYKIPLDQQHRALLAQAKQLENSIQRGGTFGIAFGDQFARCSDKVESQAFRLRHRIENYLPRGRTKLNEVLRKAASLTTVEQASVEVFGQAAKEQLLQEILQTINMYEKELIPDAEKAERFIQRTGAQQVKLLRTVDKENCSQSIKRQLKEVIRGLQGVRNSHMQDVANLKNTIVELKAIARNLQQNLQSDKRVKGTDTVEHEAADVAEAADEEETQALVQNLTATANVTIPKLPPKKPEAVKNSNPGRTDANNIVVPPPPPKKRQKDMQTAMLSINTEVAVLAAIPEEKKPKYKKPEIINDARTRSDSSAKPLPIAEAIILPERGPKKKTIVKQRRNVMPPPAASPAREILVESKKKPRASRPETKSKFREKVKRSLSGIQCKNGRVRDLEALKKIRLEEMCHEERLLFNREFIDKKHNQYSKKEIRLARMQLGLGVPEEEDNQREEQRDSADKIRLASLDTSNPHLQTGSNSRRPMPSSQEEIDYIKSFKGCEPLTRKLTSADINSLQLCSKSLLKTYARGKPDLRTIKRRISRIPSATLRDYIALTAAARGEGDAKRIGGSDADMLGVMKAISNRQRLCNERIKSNAKTRKKYGYCDKWDIVTMNAHRFETYGQYSFLNADKHRKNKILSRSPRYNYDIAHERNAIHSYIAFQTASFSADWENVYFYLDEKSTKRDRGGTLPSWVGKGRRRLAGYDKALINGKSVYRYGTNHTYLYETKKYEWGFMNPKAKYLSTLFRYR